MIFYRPTDGDVHRAGIAWKPKTCFIMSQLNDPMPPDVVAARKQIDRMLKGAGFSSVDADGVTTGKDFLLKIWHLAVACPVGIAIVHEGIRPQTLANIYYELGLMQAYGRETVVVRVGSPDLPSDLVRTEYIAFDTKFEVRFNQFIASLAPAAAYYRTVGEQLENNPLLAIDYFRRSYLLSEDAELRALANDAFETAGLSDRGKASVERLMVKF